jgi:hypothetical protein
MAMSVDLGVPKGWMELPNGVLYGVKSFRLEKKAWVAMI